MSRKPPARLVKSDKLSASDRRIQVGLPGMEPPPKRPGNGLVIKICISVIVIAAIAVWGSAFAAAALALSGQVGIHTMQQGLSAMR